MPITVDPSQVHSITVDPSQVERIPAERSFFDKLVTELKGLPRGAGQSALAGAQGFNDFVQTGFRALISTDEEERQKAQKAFQRGAYGEAARHFTNFVAPGLLDTGEAIVQGNDQARINAQKAYERGDYTSAALHLLNWAAPGGAMVDPIVKKISTAKFGEGQIGEAGGESLTTGGMMFAADSPYVRAGIGKVRSLTRTPAIVNPNPVEAAAVEFAQDRGIPVNAGMATGNKFVKNVQKSLAQTPIGAGVTEHAIRTQGEALTRVGGELADDIHPQAVTHTEAGRRLAEDINQTIAQHHAEADAHYETLREIEADPANVRNVQIGTEKVPSRDARGQTIPGKFVDQPVMGDVALPVDLREVKKMLRPVYDQFHRQLPITKDRASTGLKAIQNIIEGPDAAPASQIDRDLSAIKAAARGNDEIPELATLSQGLARHAVSKLHDAVTEAVLKAERSAPPGTAAATPAAVPAATPAATPAEAAAAPAGGKLKALTGEAPAAAPRSAETTVTVPGEPNNTYAARYEIVPQEMVDASHSGHTFEPTPAYGVDGLRNDRNYKNPVNQRKIVEWSTPEQFDSSYHISDNPDATNGPPIAVRGSDGRYKLLGGNGRDQIMQRVYAQDPEGGLGYVDKLADKAPQYGATAETARGTKKPVLLRVVDESEVPTIEAKQAAISDFNKTGTAALTPAERALADARRVSSETLEHVAGKLDKAGQDGTLAQILEGESGREIGHKLIADRVITPQEGAQFITENGLTKAGKERISQLLLGRFFRDPEQFDSLAPAIRNKVERIAAPLVRAEGEGAYNLTPHMQGAIDIIETARAHGSTVADYLDQSGMFTRQAYTPEAVALAEHLEGAKPLELTEMVRKYAEAAKYAGEYQGAGLFGNLEKPQAPREAFNAAFNTRLPEGEALSAAPEPASAPAKSEAFDAAFQSAPAAPAAPPRVPGVPAGREAMGALGKGRASTVAKYDASGVLKSLPKAGEEPAQVFEALTESKDATVERLKKVQRIAPSQIPRIGRAFIEQLLEKATTEGGFAKSQGIQTKWLNLGKETKEILFPSRIMRDNLDNFFRAARMAGENVNPSGSGLVPVSMGAGALILHDPITGISTTLGTGLLAYMLHNPAGVRALTEGLNLSRLTGAAAGTAEKALVYARILQLATAARREMGAAAPAAAAQANPPQSEPLREVASQ